MEGTEDGKKMVEVLAEEEVEVETGDTSGEMMLR